MDRSGSVDEAALASLLESEGLSVGAAADAARRLSRASMTARAEVDGGAGSGGGVGADGGAGADEGVGGDRGPGTDRGPGATGGAAGFFVPGRIEVLGKHTEVAEERCMLRRQSPFQKSLSAERTKSLALTVPEARRASSEAHRWMARLGALAVTALLMACEGPPPAVPHPPIVEHLFDLEFMDAPELPTLSALVASPVGGEGFAVAASARPLGILMFDGEGRFAETLGRRGEGPGELTVVRDIVFDREGNLWVFGDHRVEIWDDSLNHLRSLTLPITVSSAVVAPGGGTFVVGNDPGEIRVRVRHLAPDGGLVPLEVEGEAFVRGDPAGEFRSVTPVDDSSVWVAMFHRYEMRRLDRRTGDTIQRIEDHPEWWEYGDGLEDFAGLMDQSPAIQSITVGPGGTLWVVSGVPVPDADAVDALQDGDPKAITRLVDHVIRVHDGDTGSVLCEHPAEYLPLQFLSGDRAAAVLPAGDSVRVSIIELRSCDGAGDDP